MSLEFQIVQSNCYSKPNFTFWAWSTDNEVSCCTDALNLPKFLAVESDTDSQDQTQCDEIDQLRNGCRASFVGSFPSQMPRADKSLKHFWYHVCL